MRGVHALSDAYESRPPPLMQYRPEIDGLRALAVLPVILFHAGMSGFSGGYVGVDVFFVISGFLITSIIMREIEAGDFSIMRFYERRARRILPALVFVVVVSAGFGSAVMLPDQLKTFGQSMLAVTLFLSNIFFWQTTDYFKPDAELQPLLHTWSLSVEEQFYVFFPLMLILCWRHCRRHLKLVLFIAILMSLALAEIGWRFRPVANFYLLFPRGWELFVGALIALIPQLTVLRYVSQRASTWLTCVGIGLIGAAVVLFDKKLPAPSLYTVMPVVGAGLVILGTARKNPIGRVLAARPLVFVGLISYSAYLWHQPLFAFHRILSVADEGHSIPVILVPVVFVLAVFTWRYVECPFRTKATIQFTPAMIGKFSAAALSGLAGIGLLIHASDGWPERVSSAYVAQDWDRYLQPNYGLSDQCDYSDSFELKSVCVHGLQPTVLLWGDSYAMHLANGLRAAGVPFVQATKSVCGPSAGRAPLPERKAYFHAWASDCVDFNQSVFQFLRASPNIQFVLMASSFEQYVEGKYYSEQRGGYSPSDAERRAVFAEAINAIKALGKTPIMVAPPPKFGVDVGACLRRAATGLPSISNAVSSGCSFPQSAITSESNRVVDYVHDIAEQSEIDLIDLRVAICGAGRCETSWDGTPLYRDSGHLSYLGSELVSVRSALYEKLLLTGSFGSLLEKY